MLRKSLSLFLTLAFVCLSFVSVAASHDSVRLEQIGPPIPNRYANLFESNQWASETVSPSELDALHDAARLSFDDASQRIQETAQAPPAPEKTEVEAIPGWLAKWIGPHHRSMTSPQPAPAMTRKQPGFLSLTLSAHAARTTELSNDLTANQKYCQHMSRLLSASLGVQDSSHSRNDVARQRAIEAALLMVADTAAAQAESEMAELKSAHQLELANLQKKIRELQSQTSKLTGQSVVTEDSVKQIFSEQWQQILQRFYAEQTRSQQQMQLIAGNQSELDNKIAKLSAAVARVNAVPPQVIQNPLFTDSPRPANPTTTNSRQSDRSLTNAAMLRPLAESAMRDEESTLNQQIREMRSRLDEIHQYKVRRAGHLEPLYSTDKSLLPMRQR